MSTITRNNFAGQIPGNPVTAVTSSTSGTGFTLFTYDPETSSQSWVTGSGFSSGKGLRFSCVAGERNYGDIQLFNSTSLSVGVEFLCPPTPALTRSVGKVKTAAGNCLSLYITAARKFQVNDSAGSLVYLAGAAMTAGTVYDLQFHMIDGAGTGGLVIQYSLVGGSVIETQTYTNKQFLSGNITTLAIGKAEGSAEAFDLDVSNIRAIDGNRVIISTLNQYLNGYSGQTDGTVVTSALTDQSGDALGTAPTQNSPGTIKFEADTDFPGTHFCIEVLPDTGQTCFYQVAYLNSINVSDSDQWKVPPAPAADCVVRQIGNGVGVIAQLVYLTTGKLQLRTGAAGTQRWTSAVAGASGVLPVGDVIDVKWAVLSDVAAGRVDVRLTQPNSNTADEEFTTSTANPSGINTRGGAITYVRWGKPGAAAGVVNAGRWGNQRVTDGVFGYQDKWPGLIPPVSDAGADFLSPGVEPWTTQPLVGTASGSDGTIVTSIWTQISGTPVTIANTAAASTSYVVPGTLDGDDLVFGYQVVDSNGLYSQVAPVTHHALSATERKISGLVEVPMRWRKVSP